MNAPLVIAGQSHLRSYLPAGLAPAEEVHVVEASGARVVDGPLPRDATYWAEVAELAQDGTVALVWGGDQPDHFLIERTTPLDFVLSTAPDLPLDPRASYVAESQLRAAFAPSFAGFAEVIAQLRSGGAAVRVAGTAPPIGDREALAGRVASGEPLASPYTVQKIWSLVQTMTAEVAAAAGAVFVAVPDRLRSPEGFLLPAYWGEGLVPGAGFGREMIAELAGLEAVR